MTTMIITIGAPGSGKTFWAQNWIYRLGGQGTCRLGISRDSLRKRLGYPQSWTPDSHPQFEDAITRTQRQEVVKAIRNGFDVVIDDTNCHQERLERLIDLGRDYAEVFVRDCRGTSLETCLERNARRSPGTRVPDGEIRMMHDEGSVVKVPPELVWCDLLDVTDRYWRALAEHQDACQAARGSAALGNGPGCYGSQADSAERVFREDYARIAGLFADCGYASHHHRIHAGAQVGAPVAQLAALMDRHA